MKKLLIIMLSALLLAGCGTDETKKGANEIISSAVDLDNLQMNPEPGVVGSTIRHLTDITAFKTDEEVDNFISAPPVCISGEKTYLIRNFPEELTGADAFYSFIETKEYFSEIEVYTGDDYSAPSEVIELKGFDDPDVNRTWRTIYYDESAEKFYLTGSMKIGEEYPGVLHIFSKDGSLISWQELSFDRLNDHLIHDGMIYILHSRGDWGRKASLTAENIETGEEISISETALTVFRGEDCIYYLSLEADEDYNNEYVLFRCGDDPGSSERIMSVPLDTIGEDKLNFAAYDSNSGALYWSDFNGIHVIYGGKDYSLLKTQSASAQILQLSGERLLLEIGCNQIAVYQAESDFESLADQQIALKVCCYGFGEDYMKGMFGSPLEQMNAAGMLVDFEYTFITNSKEEYISTMAKKFLAGDTDFDLFIVESTMSELFEGEYFEDLGSYSVLAEYMDQAIDGVKGLCTIDGKLALIPRTLTLNMLQDKANPKEEPPVMTYREFMDNAEKPEDGMYWFGGMDEGRAMLPWFKELQSNFTQRTVSDEKVREDLEMLYTDMLTLGKNDAFIIEREYSEQPIRYRVDSVGTSTYAAPIPSLGVDYKPSVSGIYLGMNPNSKNKDIAAAYMAYYLDMCVTNRFYQTEEYFETYDGKSCPAYREQLKNCIRRTEDSELFWQISDISTELVSGKITPSEAAEKTFRYMKMVRDE